MQRNIRILFSLLIICLVGAQLLPAQEDFRKTAPEPGPAPEIKLGDFEDFTLDNGLKVLLVENHKLPRVSFQLFVDVPLHLEGETAGQAMLAGDLLRNGTSQRSKAEIDEAVDFLGATLSTSSSGIYASSLTKHREKLLDIMSEVLLQPAFDPAEFDKLKKQTLSGLAQAESDPNAIATNVTQAVRFGKDHPYGELVTKETVAQVSLEDARKFYQQYFKPNISYLIMVGDLNESEARKLAQQYFGSWKRGEVERRDFAQPKPPAKPQVSYVTRPGSVQSVINITYPIDLQPGTKEAMRMQILNTILGNPGSMSNRLFKNLREDKAYTYGAYSSFDPDPYVGYFNASASVRNEVTDSAVDEFMKELRRISSQPVSDRELQQAKSFIMGSFARTLENPQQIAQYALNTLRYDLPRDYYQNYLQKVESTSANDLLEVAKQYILPERAHVVVVGEKSQAEKLQRFAGDGTVVYLDTKGKKIEQTNMAVPADMSAAQVIDNYLKALGGRKQLETVKDMTMKLSSEVQGMKLSMTRQIKQPGKSYVAVEAGGMKMNEMISNADKVRMVQMGQEVPLEAADAAEIRRGAIIFPELSLTKDGYTVELIGTEQIDGQAAYVLEYTDPDGNKQTEYFATDTGLKIRSVKTSGETTVVTDFSEYREVNGIKFPFQVSQTGMAPFPLNFAVESVEINTGLADSLFEIK